MRINAIQKCKTVKQAAVGAVVFSFLFTSLACCCLTHGAHADSATQIAKKIPSCHKHSTSQKSQTQQNKSCDCCKITGQAADLIAKALDINPVLKQFGQVQALMVQAYHPNFICLSHLNTGPPVFHNSIPIYLQNSNLRL